MKRSNSQLSLLEIIYWQYRIIVQWIEHGSSKRLQFSFAADIDDIAIRYVQHIQQLLPIVFKQLA